MSNFDLAAMAISIFESLTRPAILSESSTLSGRLDGVSQRVDPERFLALTQENERVSRAATVLAAAQLLSNGYSQRALSRNLGFSNASNFSKDRLWAQLASLAETITEAREAGTPQLAEVHVQVPISRSETRTYGFRDVPTSL